MAISDRIRTLRVQYDFTQADVGNRLDPPVTKAAVASWESGKARPRLKRLQQLADIFNVTVADLMSDEAPIPAVGSPTTMVPLLGWTHMGEAIDEDGCERMVGVPSDVVDAHPDCYLLHAQGECMDNRFPEDCVVLIDPHLEPRNGDAVLAEVDGYRSVVREYARGTNTIMLTADSHSGEFDDIVSGPDDDPVLLKGVVVWYQSERDLRR